MSWLDGVPLVGREEELRELREALAPRRIVVLTGPPGSGKSALARHVTPRGSSSPQVFRVEDIGLRERPEVTLLRLLESLGARPGRLTAAIGAPADGLLEPVIEICRRELADRIRPVLVVDGARGPLLDALQSVLDGTDCQVLAVAEEEGIPPAAYTYELGDLALPAARRLISDTTGYSYASGYLYSSAATGEAAGDRLVRPATLDRPALTPLALRIGAALAGTGGKVGELPDTLPRLVDLALARLNRDAARLCDALAALTGPGGLWLPDELVAHLLPGADSSDGHRTRNATAELRELRLLERDKRGVRLHRAVAEQVTRHWSPEQVADRAVAAALPLLREARRSPALVADHATTYLLLLTRVLPTEDPEARGFSAYLAGELAHRGKVFELLALRQCVRHTLGEDGDAEADADLAAAPALALRRCEEPGLARVVLSRDDPAPSELLQLALLERDLGRLHETERLLAGLSAGRGADGWVLHTKAAVACDRGDLRGVGPLLRRAIEAHQVAGDLRGEAWAVLEYGRWCLLRGDFEAAVKRLSAARVMFLDIKDAYGRDCADIELLRLSAVSRANGRPVADWQNSDVRALWQPPVRSWAVAWRALHAAMLAEGTVAGPAVGVVAGSVSGTDVGPLGGSDGGSVVGPDTGPIAGSSFVGPGPAPFAALQRLDNAVDPVGGAWHTHCLGIREDRRTYLEAAARAFGDTGCPHGQAWSALELGIRQPEHGPSRHALARARALFESLGDEAGKAWTDLAQAVLDGEPPPRGVLWELSRRYAPQLLAGIEWPEEHGRFRIPRAARHTIPEPRHDGLARFPTTESRIRLTLLDDTPAADDAARIALRLVPGVHHPWAGAAGPALPWLSARAVPLTSAEVQPEHAVTIRPSAADDPDAGAEFRFTPRRPGRHRIRFVVEHHDTGTVLQEVETEIDVTDARGSVPSAAPPLTEPLRGR